MTGLQQARAQNYVKMHNYNLLCWNSGSQTPHSMSTKWSMPMHDTTLFAPAGDGAASHEAWASYPGTLHTTAGKTDYPLQILWKFSHIGVGLCRARNVT